MLEININGKKELIEKIGKVNDAIKDKIVMNMRISTMMIKQRARELVPVDTGALRRSIRDVTRATDKSVTGIVGTTMPYGAGVEFGTKPHWPPPGALDKWARKRGLNPYLVARAIAKKGTKPHPYMIPAFRELKDKIIQSFKRIIEGAISTK